MANHGFVKTRKHMTPEKITLLLETINQAHFKGNLKIEYYHATGKDLKSAWGPHTWVITYISPIDHQEYAGRVCWLNTRRSFEMRHGGGSDFAWWFDQMVINEVALQFEGMISDDGVGGKWKGKKGHYNSLIRFIKRMWHYKEGDESPRNQEKLTFIERELQEIVPPELRDGVK